MKRLAFAIQKEEFKDIMEGVSCVRDMLQDGDIEAAKKEIEPVYQLVMSIWEEAKQEAKP